MALVERSKFGLNELLGATVQHRVIASKSRLQNEVAPSGCSWKFACYCGFEGAEPRLLLTNCNALSKAESEFQDSLVGRQPIELVRGDLRHVRPSDIGTSYRKARAMQLDRLRWCRGLPP